MEKCDFLKIEARQDCLAPLMPFPPLSHTHTLERLLEFLARSRERTRSLGGRRKKRKRRKGQVLYFKVFSWSFLHFLAISKVND